MELFSFEERNRVYLPINFKPADDATMQPFRFKVDTGADSSAISKERLYDLGYDHQWILNNLVVDRSISTADGRTVPSGIIQIPLINILGYEAKNWPFLILLEDGKDFRNLLGRDLLSGFNYTFSNDEKVFTIARAKDFEYIWDPLAGQEIHEIQKDDNVSSSIQKDAFTPSDKLM
ncbi:MAG: retroviral-like aspartic protease family protein [Defluviitaleaceae bacterium]|nr:retroviral-like aspartic protease family protein [Defluviitaleaceae bacterium]